MCIIEINLFMKDYNIEIASKEKTQKHLIQEMVKKYTWECPCCAEVFESDDYDSPIGFARKLINDVGVRYVNMKYMQGLFCPTCFNDPEIQDSSL